jgi:hypothetical protein
MLSKILLWSSVFFYFHPLLSTSFCPPSNWKKKIPSSHSPFIKLLFVGETEQGFAPSMNLAIEETTASLEEYTQAVKKICQTPTIHRWRDLGFFTAGEQKGRLLSMEKDSPWGTISIFQLLVLHENKAYILTASTLKNTLSQWYSPLEHAFRSLNIKDE